MKMKNKWRKETGVIGTLLLSALALFLLLICVLPVILSAVSSFQAFDFNKPLLRSPWIGLEIYRSILTDGFWTALRGSLLLGLLGGILPVLPGFFIGRAVCGKKTSWLLTGALLLPCFLPPEAFGALLMGGRAWEIAWMPYWAWFLLGTALQTLSLTAFLSAALGRLMEERGGFAGEGAALGAGLVLALGLIFLLSPDRNLCQILLGPDGRMLATLSSYRPRALMGQAITPYGALQTLTLLLQLPGATAGGILLAVIFRRLSQMGGKMKARQESKTTSAALFAAAAGLLLLTALILQLPFFHKSPNPENLWGLAGSSLLLLGLAALLFLLLIPAGGWLLAGSGSGWLAVSVLMLLLMENPMGQSLAFRLIHLENPWLQSALTAANAAHTGASAGADPFPLLDGTRKPAFLRQF